MAIKVENIQDIEKVNAVLHDQVIDGASIKQKEGSGELYIRFLIEDLKQKRVIKRRIIYSVLEVPLYECWLKINNVIEYNVKDKSRIKHNIFNEIIFQDKKNLLILDALTHYQVEIVIDGLNFELEDSNRITGNKAYIREDITGISKTWHKFTD